jgi:hypothetical protein
MVKGNRTGRPVWPHRVKGKDNLATTLRPAAMLRSVVLTDIQGGETGGAVCGQVKREYPSRRVACWRVTLVNTCAPSLDLGAGADRRKEPAEYKQRTRKRPFWESSCAHDE